MNASLIEMVLAIALTGLILASAVMPTVQTVVANQEAELDWQTMMTHSAAAIRAEQVAGMIWRDPNAPDGYFPLRAARVDQLQVGNWQLRADGTAIEQQAPSGSWTPIAGDVQGFGLQYLLNSGAWTSSPNAVELDKVIAIRFNWSQANHGLRYGGLLAVADREYSAGPLSLRTLGAGPAYRRSDYARHTTLSLGTWR
jgi:hypothetical protein